MRFTVLRDYYIFYVSPLALILLLLLWPFTTILSTKAKITAATILLASALARNAITPCALCQSVMCHLNIPFLPEEYKWMLGRWKPWCCGAPCTTCVRRNVGHGCNR